MHKPAIWLALAVLAGCGEPPAEVTTETSTTDASPTSGSPSSTTQSDPTADTGQATMAASTGEEVCPPMPPDDGGYDACPGLCGGGGQCFNDGQEYAVCTRGCFMDCNCWPAPQGDGDAPVRCSSELLESTSVCVLDCSAGQTCPQGMFCVAELGICAHPFPGSDDTTGGTTDMSSTTDMGSTGGTTDMGSTGGTTDMGSTGGTTDMTGTTGMGSTGGTTDMTGTTDVGSTGGTGSSGGSSTGMAT